MAIPVKTSVEDIEALCHYFSTKPTGATVKEAKAIIDPKHLDIRKISAVKGWNLVEETGGKLKVTNAGRTFARGDKNERHKVLRQVIAGCAPYSAVVERAAHRPQEDSISAVDVAAHWHGHFHDEVGKTDETLNDQAICFLNLAQGAGLNRLARFSNM